MLISHGRRTFGCALVVTAMAACGGDAISVVSSDATFPPHYAFPIVGNGSLVLGVDGAGDQCQQLPSYRMHVPEVVWEGRRYNRTDNSAALISMGHWNTRISVDGVELGKPISWKQTLDRERAVLTCETEYAAARVVTEVFVAADHNIVAVRKRVRSASAKQARIEFAYSFSAKDEKAPPPRVALSPLEFANGVVRFPYVAYAHKVYRGEIRLYGGEKASFPEVCAARAVCERNFADGMASADFLLAYADNYDEDIPGNVERRANQVLSTGRKPTYDEICSIVEEQRRDEFPVAVRDARLAALESVVRRGYDAILCDHECAWRQKQGRFYVNLPDKRLNDAWRTALYNLRVFSTKWSIPVGIFGRGREWSGRYFGWDESFSAIGAMSAGEFAIGRLPTEFRRKLLVPAVMRSSYYRAPTLNAFGARYVWETLEDGTEGTTDGLWLDHVFHASTIAECAWRNYLWSGDLDFLRDRAYPVMRESALYLLTHCVLEREGRVTIGKCTDIERLGPAVENPFLTACGAIRTFETAARAEELLGAGDGNAERFRRAVAGLRRSLPRRDGRYVPFEGCAENSIVTVCGYYPFPVISRDDPCGVAAVRYFADNIVSAGNMVPMGKGVCSWYASWTGCALASIGDGEGAWNSLHKAAQGMGLFAEPWEILEIGSHPWFVSAGANYLTALASLLVGQDENSKQVRLAWAVPVSLREYSFCLPVYGGGWVELAVDGDRIAHFEHSPGDREFILPPVGR